VAEVLNGSLCTRFLETASDLLLLRRVGKGYAFTHRIFLEHFASRTDWPDLWSAEAALVI
jgi:hypothetical protein